MTRLFAALAVAPVLFATSAYAQTVTEEVAEQMWCGVAFTVLFAQPENQLDAKSMERLNGAAAQLVAVATQAYLDAGNTEEQVTKIKADLVPEVTPVVTTGAPGKYSDQDCYPLLQKYMAPAPADSSTSDQPEQSSAAATPDASSSAESASSSAAQ